MSAWPQRWHNGSFTRGNRDLQFSQIMGPNLPHPAQTVGKIKSKALLAHFEALGFLAVSVTVAFNPG